MITIRKLAAALALAALAAPVPLAAQQPPDSTADRMRRGPMELLIQHRDSLGLTDDQVARLREIRDRVIDANAPLVREMLQIRREVREKLPEDVRERRGERPLRRLDPELRRELRPQLERTRELLRQIRTNNRRAMNGVRDVLTEEQRERIRSWVRDRRREFRGRRRPGPGHRDARRRPPRGAGGR